MKLIQRKHFSSNNMYKGQIMRVIFFAILLGSIFISGCEESSDAVNAAPTIEEIIFSPATPVNNTTVTLNTVATDVDGDSLSYNWSAIVGSFSNSGTGNPVSWYIDEPGTVEITCIVSDGKEITSKSVTVAIGQQVGSIGGYVYDNDSNELLAGVVVSLGGYSITSQNDGSYLIQDIPTRFNYQLIATFAGYETYTSTTDIYEGERTRDLYLVKETGYFTGYVYNSVTNEPVESAHITIENHSTYSGSNGFYQLNSVPLGERILWAMRQGYATYSDTVQVISGETPYDIYIENN